MRILLVIVKTKLCNYKVTQASDLKKHVQSVHEGVKHNCELCEYKATQKGSLRQHVKSVHKGVKYNCDVCDYKAPTKDKLRNMMELNMIVMYRYVCNYKKKPTVTIM